MDYSELIQNRSSYRRSRRRTSRRRVAILIAAAIVIVAGLGAGIWALVRHVSGGAHGGDPEPQTTVVSREETDAPGTEAPETEPPTEPAPVPFADQTETRTGWITAYGKLNVRSMPDADAEVIGHYVYHAQVTVEGAQQNGFLKLTGADSRSGEEVTGFASAEFVSEEEPADPYVYLDVPVYRQGDVRWSGVRLGRSRHTIGSAGCTTTCIAMLRSYVQKKLIRPDETCASLTYGDQGDLAWPSDLETHETKGYLELILRELNRGYPVMVGAKGYGGNQHWVLVIGYEGDGTELRAVDFRINDPGKDKRDNLKQFIEDYPRMYKLATYAGD